MSTQSATTNAAVSQQYPHIHDLATKFSTVVGHPVRVDVNGGRGWDATFKYTFTESGLLRFVESVNPKLLQDSVERLLRSEDPKREEFTVDEAIRIALANGTAAKKVPSVSRTLVARIFELDPECRARFKIT